MTRMVVCGATGFIGRNALERLARRPDREIVAVWHDQDPVVVPGVTWTRADLRQPADAARVLDGADTIVQAAAATSGAGETVASPHLHVTDNAVLNSVLLRAAYEARVRHVLFFSCSIMYPSSATPVSETDASLTDGTLEAYFGAAWTKIYVEKMCEFYASLGRSRFTVIRHSNIYGPHDKFDLARSHVFGATVTKALEGSGPIVVWGDGGEGRDLLHVDDLLESVERLLDRQDVPFELVNVGSGDLVTVADLVDRINRAAGSGREVRYDRSAPTLKTSVCLDTRRVRERYGWEPRIALDEGIRRTVDWRRTAIASGRVEETSGADA